jgi:hypothetical protein
MIQQRVNTGITAIKAKISGDGHFTTEVGIVRRRLGRPGAEPKQIFRARQGLAEGLWHRRGGANDRARDGVPSTNSSEN